MAFYIGNTKISKVYVGATQIVSAYVGSAPIFSGEEDVRVGL